MLAFYLYPFEPRNESIAPVEYTKEELMSPSKVEELFDYCQILEAYITRAGWEFLIQVHGYEGLYKIRNCTNRLKPLEQSAEGSNGANSLCRTDRHFIVFGKTAGIVNPGQRTLHNPPLR